MRAGDWVKLTPAAAETNRFTAEKNAEVTEKRLALRGTILSFYPNQDARVVWNPDTFDWKGGPRYERVAALGLVKLQPAE